MRLKEHPILDKLPARKPVKITVNNKKITAYAGESLAAALVGAGIKTLKITKKFHMPRGIFCAIGRCPDCLMTVNGRKNVRICLEKVAPGMNIALDNYEAKDKKDKKK